MKADINAMLEVRKAERAARKIKEARRKLATYIISVIAVVFIASMFISSKSVAASDVEYHKYYLKFQITDGMTIEDIAEEYAIPEMTTKEHYAREVRFMNNLDSSENPNSGKYIIIPYYDTIHS